MDEAMIVRGMADRTRETYVWAVTGLLRLTGVDVSRCPVCGDGCMQITAIVVREAPPPDTS